MRDEGWQSYCFTYNRKMSTSTKRHWNNLGSRRAEGTTTLSKKGQKGRPVKQGVGEFFRDYPESLHEHVEENYSQEEVPAVFNDP